MVEDFVVFRLISAKVVNVTVSKSKSQESFVIKMNGLEVELVFLKLDFIQTFWYQSNSFL